MGLFFFRCSPIYFDFMDIYRTFKDYILLPSVNTDCHVFSH
jgi:hypothetical protein